jgi:hypothetical protein
LADGRHRRAAEQSWPFAAFAKRHPEYRTIVCETEDKIGMFFIAANASPAPAEAQI